MLCNFCIISLSHFDRFSKIFNVRFSDFIPFVLKYIYTSQYNDDLVGLEIKRR